MALVGSARIDGNTSYAVRLATEELERRGLRTRTVMLCEYSVASCDAHDHPGSFDDPRAAEEIEQLLDLVYAADALGDAERSEELHEKMIAMASQLAERLLPTRAEAQAPDPLSGGPE